MEGQEASHFWVCKQLQKPDQKEVKKKKSGTYRESDIYRN
jgi:hypothetical protein